MASYYDRRAERTVAEADAERSRAEAEAMRARTAIEVERERHQREREVRATERQDRAEQDRAKAERIRSKAADRAERRRQSKADRAARYAAARRGAGALAAAVAERSPVIVGAIAMGAPIAIAWRGQMEFATNVMNLGFMAPALPIALEGGVWYLAFLVHRAIQARLPIGRYRAATWMLAGIAAGMNLWHGIHANGDDGLQVGVILALASLLGIALWELTASLTQQTTARRSAAEIRRATWRRIRYPRLSWAAASIRASRGADCSIEDAWTAAWADRYGVGPGASRRDRKLARSIVKYERKADRAAAKSGQLVIVDGAIVRPGALTSKQSEADAEAGKEAMAALRVFTERREDVAKSIAFPAFGASSSIEAAPRPAIESGTDSARTGSAPRPRTELARTESVRTKSARTESPRTAPVRTAPARGDSLRTVPPLTPVDREEAVAEIRQEIADAAARGEVWTPDYAVLEERYDRRRSWCEKAVREARTGLRTEEEEQARTDAEETRTPPARTEPQESGTDSRADGEGAEQEVADILRRLRTDGDDEHPVRATQTRTDSTGDSDQARTEVSA
ncbi:DUF2637 domain-containing protein [Streptosporangium sp. NPDC000509]|uniref:DUF2637 domain-containing protein n=1 Tax=Streptosporangium sp. NPDC000509 TaxID=3366186 RepID=UPI0036773648